MKKSAFILAFAVLAVLISPSLVSAHDGGHDGCFLNGLPTGHTTTWTDPECALNATDGCDARNLNAINSGRYIPSNDVCNYLKARFYE